MTMPDSWRLHRRLAASAGDVPVADGSMPCRRETRGPTLSVVALGAIGGRRRLAGRDVGPTRSQLTVRAAPVTICSSGDSDARRDARSCRRRDDRRPAEGIDRARVSTRFAQSAIATPHVVAILLPTGARATQLERRVEQADIRSRETFARCTVRLPPLARAAEDRGDPVGGGRGHREDRGRDREPSDAEEGHDAGAAHPRPPGPPHPLQADRDRRDPGGVGGASSRRASRACERASPRHGMSSRT